MSFQLLHNSIRAIRWRLSLTVALACFVGAVMYSPEWRVANISLIIGSFFLCAAYSLANQIQERKRDRLMRRTATRPLATRTMSVSQGLVVLIMLIATALSFLLPSSESPVLVMMVIMMVAILYNGLYTIFKQRSGLALLPGAVAGALPPVLGWVWAGGSHLHPDIVTLFSLFLIWQIPHTWLLNEHHADDCRHALLPVIQDFFGPTLYPAVRGVWVVAFSVSLLALPGLGIISAPGARILMAGIAVIPCVFLCIPHRSKRPAGRPLYHALNISLAASCLILVTDRIFT